MNFSLTKCPLVFFLSSLFIHATLGELICEELPNHVCAFSVSSSGKRCLLETIPGNDESMDKQCRTSEVVVEKLADYIETDECVKACGVDRDAVGISSDAFLEPHFLNNLCTFDCYEKCPNLVELYFNLAAGEGVFLPYLCERQRSEPHRDMREFSSSSTAYGPASEEVEDAMAPAPGPASGKSGKLYEEFAYAPGPASEKLYEEFAPAPGPASGKSGKLYEEFAYAPVSPVY